MPPDDLLKHYLKWRQPFEIGFWVVFFLLSAMINSLIVLFDIDRAHLSFAPWQPVVWEWSSNLVILALVPAVIGFERWVPLKYGFWLRHLPWHVLASIAFSLMHVLGMVVLRKLAYLAMGSVYDFGSWPRELLYEYLKDGRTYAAILSVVYLYRLSVVSGQIQSSRRQSQ